MSSMCLAFGMMPPYVDDVDRNPIDLGGQGQGGLGVLGRRGTGTGHRVGKRGGLGWPGVDCSTTGEEG